jgi:2-iminobutanoate/2-iminopropanoate deaminase
MRSLICLLAGLSLALPLAAQKKAVNPPELAGASPFSPGILVDGTLYVAGQIGQDLKTRQVPADFEAEVKACLDRVGIVLKAAGMTFDDAVTVSVYLTDMDLFQRMNAVYATYFKDPRPARTTVGVTKLAAPGARIEITVTAHK